MYSVALKKLIKLVLFKNLIFDESKLKNVEILVKICSKINLSKKKIVKI